MESTAFELRYSLEAGPAGIPGPKHAHGSVFQRFGAHTSNAAVVQFSRRLDSDAECPRSASGGLQQRGFPGPGGDIPCPPPFCEWTFPAQDTVLVTYVNAAVDVSADLLVGFSGKEFWLPELTIALPRDTFGTDIVEFRMDERFGENLRPGLEDYIRNRVSRDVEAYLEPLVTDRPEMRMAAFPGAITTFLQLYNGIPVAVTEALGALAVYRQSGGSKSLEYTVTESLVYWNIDMEEGVSNFLFPE